MKKLLSLMMATILLGACGVVSCGSAAKSEATTTAATEGSAVTDITTAATTEPADPWNGNTASVQCLFSMGGVSGKYIRIGGDVDTVSIEQLPAQAMQSINTREIVVYGAKK